MNRYFDFIGVQNKGYRIVTFILIIICPIIYVLDKIGFEGDILLKLLFLENVKNSLTFYSILLLPTIIVGVIVKVTNWVKGGFKIEEIRNLKNTLKLLLSFILLNFLMMVFGIKYLEIFSTGYGDEGGVTIDGLRFDEETLLFGFVLLFIYWIFWGFKKKESSV